MERFRTNLKLTPSFRFLPNYEIPASVHLASSNFLQDPVTPPVAFHGANASFKMLSQSSKRVCNPDF